MKDYNIREAEYKDLDAILKLMTALQAVVSFDSAIDKDTLEKSFEKMNESGEHYYNLVAVIDETVVGFISVVFYKTFFQENGNGLINELIVDQEYRHQGIGKSLVEGVDQEAKRRKVDGLDVETEIFNIKAQSFYKKNGFDHQYVLLGKVYRYD